MATRTTAAEGLTLTGISKTYKLGRNKVAAVKDVNLTVASGELIAIIGPSGSGKTTLAHMLGGLAKPDEGEVRINGQELRRKSDRALSRYRNRQAGFIFQTFGLIPHYTAIENVTIPLVVAGISKRARNKRAMQYLTMLGLEEQAKQRADTLSGGQRQRVAIARALIQSPSIIIADEPTGSLDSANGEEVMQILEQLAHKHHITVIFVTHDLQLARRADRIVHMKDGVLTEEHHARR